MKRVFIAIDLPKETKEKIEKAILPLKTQFSRDEVRFIKPGNWHLTLVFLGYQNDLALAPITGALEKSASEFFPFNVELNKIIYGPSDKKSRMIWIINDKIKDAGLAPLAENLVNNLTERGVRFKIEHRPFFCHLNLARFNRAPEKLVDLPQIKINFDVTTINLMESELRRAGAEYKLISATPLGKNRGPLIYK